jgi:hypothetical protein
VHCAATQRFTIEAVDTVNGNKLLPVPHLSAPERDYCEGLISKRCEKHEFVCGLECMFNET